MLKKLLLDLSPRQTWALVALACVGLLGFGAYLQHVVGLEPCPMCIVQRYAMTGIGLVAVVAVFGHKGWLGWVMTTLGTGLALGGAFVAARQSWLQWYPPETLSCGRDFYGMVESFPLQRAIPMIFRGGGDCTKIDWTFLGGSIANWSFVAFVAMAVWMLVFAFLHKQNTQPAPEQV
jgi:disulfide bond formation protein DsbB